MMGTLKTASDMAMVLRSQGRCGEVLVEFEGVWRKEPGERLLRQQRGPYRDRRGLELCRRCWRSGEGARGGPGGIGHGNGIAGGSRGQRLLQKMKGGWSYLNLNTRIRCEYGEVGWYRQLGSSTFLKAEGIYLGEFHVWEKRDGWSPQRRCSRSKC